jgi:hypothetical protein
MRHGTTRTNASMYCVAEPSNVVRNSRLRGAPRSRRAARSGGHRATSPQRAAWMNESFCSGAATKPVRRARGQLTRIHHAHHQGTGLRSVSGDGALV